jgi:hypothetical protein
VNDNNNKKKIQASVESKNVNGDYYKHTLEYGQASFRLPHRNNEKSPTKLQFLVPHKDTQIGTSVKTFFALTSDLYMRSHKNACSLHITVHYCSPVLTKICLC